MNGIEYHYAESGDIELILTQGQPRAYPWHMHTRHWTVGLVRQGSALLTTAFDVRRLYAGQHFFLRPYEPHSLNVEQKSSLLVLCFDADNDFAQYSRDDSLLNRSVLAVVGLIIKNPAEVLHIDQMASYAGYSQWHFLRAFQKIMKMTPHAFQLLCRLRLLRSMLRADTASSTAAVSAGFADQSHMHKVFKHHHGMTPGEFKKSSFKLEL